MIPSCFIQKVYNSENELTKSIKWDYLESVENSFSYIKNDSYAKNQLHNNILSYIRKLPYPNSKRKESSLVVGKVQSGKTTHFSCLSAALIDVGYDIIVILGGTNNALLSQNILRAKETFGDNKLHVYTNDDLKSIDPSVINSELAQGNRTIFCIMKETKNLDNLLTIFKNSILYFKNMALIDDEGDLASLSNSNTVQKVINSKIQDFVSSSFETSLYVAYTATPQGNLLIPKNSWQYPKSINLIEPNENKYQGVSAFHSKNITDKILICDDQFSLLHDAIYLAVQLFVLSILFPPSESPLRHLEMIIHSARINEDQDSIFYTVNSYLGKILSLPISEILYRSCDMAGIHSDAVLSCEKQYINRILLENVKICKLYGESNEKAPIHGEHSLTIYIGGEMLGRGVTFYPVVTYITRTSSVFYMDSLLQRARWFGYRKQKCVFLNNTLYDVMKIYVEEQNRRAFSTICKHEKSLWDTLRVIHENDISMHSLDFPLVSDLISLLPTNKEKLGEHVEPMSVKQEYILDLSKSFPKEHFGKKMSIMNVAANLVDTKTPINIILRFVAICSFLEITEISISDTGMCIIKEISEIYIYGQSN